MSEKPALSALFERSRYLTPQAFFYYWFPFLLEFLFTGKPLADQRREQFIAEARETWEQKLVAAERIESNLSELIEKTVQELEEYCALIQAGIREPKGWSENQQDAVEQFRAQLMAWLEQDSSGISDLEKLRQLSQQLRNQKNGFIRHGADEHGYPKQLNISAKVEPWFKEEYQVINAFVRQALLARAAWIIKSWYLYVENSNNPLMAWPLSGEQPDEVIDDHWDKVYLQLDLSMFETRDLVEIADLVKGHFAKYMTLGLPLKVHYDVEPELDVPNHLKEAIRETEEAQPTEGKFMRLMTRLEGYLFMLRTFARVAVSGGPVFVGMHPQSDWRSVTGEICRYIDEFIQAAPAESVSRDDIMSLREVADKLTALLDEDEIV